MAVYIYLVNRGMHPSGVCLEKDQVIPTPLLHCVYQWEESSLHPGCGVSEMKK